MSLLITAMLGVNVRSKAENNNNNHLDHHDDEEYWLRWRVAVEANEAGPWRAVPDRCERHVAQYMMGGEYEDDVEVVKEEIMEYVMRGGLIEVEVEVEGTRGSSSMVWVMDVDDTCISNVGYYKGKRFGCDGFNSGEFKEWIRKGECKAIPGMLQVFLRLLERGFKVVLITGRDQDTMGHVTALNLHRQGFIGYHRLILRSKEYKGMSTIKYKSDIRRKIEEEGYKIWGNIGDQWSDLQGDSLGNRIFKLPNPMYYIP